MALPNPEPFIKEVLRKTTADVPRDPLVDAAYDADAAPTGPDPGDLWSEVVAGRMRPYIDRLGPDRSYAILRSTSRASGICCPLSAAEATVLLRVLCGDQQKVI